MAGRPAWGHIQPNWRKVVCAGITLFSIGPHQGLLPERPVMLLYALGAETLRDDPSTSRTDRVALWWCTELEHGVTTEPTATLTLWICCDTKYAHVGRFE